jgi:putative transposase
LAPASDHGAVCLAVFQLFLSFKDVELVMAFRGAPLSYENIRLWCNKFGPDYGTRLKRKRPKIGGPWFLDELFLKIDDI